MQRVISLFQEPDEGYGPLQAQARGPLPGAVREPLYFLQLLEYLRQRREAMEAYQRQMAALEQGQAIGN